jgi:transcriptional regulator GlxA family with amidase domain
VRHLTRVFQRELGVTPGRYVESVRVEAAKARLQRSDEPLATIARASGFGSDETMRRAFSRELSATPAVHRERFRTTGVAPSAGVAGRAATRSNAVAAGPSGPRRRRLRSG